MSKEEFLNGKEGPCPSCGKAFDHIHPDKNNPKKTHKFKKGAANLMREMKGIERTRTVDTSNKGDLIDHLVNAHGFNPEFYKLIHPVHRMKYGNRMELNLNEIQDMHYIDHLAKPVDYHNEGTEHRHL